MARIPLPIPQSTWSWLRSLFGGPLFDLFWATFVTVVIVGLAYLLVVASPVLGGAIAGAALATLISSRVRRAVRDIYRRDFAALTI